MVARAKAARGEKAASTGAVGPEEKGGAETPLSLLWGSESLGLRLPKLKVRHESSKLGEEATAEFRHVVAGYCQRHEGGLMEDARPAGVEMKREAKVGMRGICAHVPICSLSPVSE